MLTPVTEHRETPRATTTNELFESSSTFSNTQEENEWNLNDYSDYFNDDVNYLLEILEISEDHNE